MVGKLRVRRLIAVSLSGGSCDSNGEKYFTHCQCALSYCESVGGKPHLSLIDEELFKVNAEGTFAKDRDEQFFSVGWIVLDWNARSRIFRDFIAGGAGRGWISSHFERLDDAEPAG